MPEGPSIVLVREDIKQFSGEKVISVEGNSKIDQERILNKKVISIRTWGKHLLICFNGFIVRVHFLMFGSYRVNERKEQAIRLNLTFKTGEINFYSAAIKMLEGSAEENYDFSEDVMNEEWNPANALKKLKSKPERLICDSLMEQDIFSGVGNIIKNEVLYRVKVHPESKTGKVPLAKLKAIVKEARDYSFEFLAWKKEYVLKKHWLVYNKKICPRCDLPISRKKTGVKERRSFFCTNCQILYE